MNVLYTPSGRAGEYANHGYALNLYNFCTHGCRYCYVPAVLRKTREDFYKEGLPRKDVLVKLGKDLHKCGKLPEPIFLCFTCDPYQPIEKELGITRRAIELIKVSGNNVRILTKGAELAARDFDLLGSNDEFGVTLTTWDYDSLRRWEPNAASPHTRMQTIMAAHDLGIYTWESFEPVLDPDWTLAMIEQIAPWSNMIKVGMLNHVHDLDPALAATLPSVNWGEFGREAEALLKRLGVNYYIKTDLRKMMEAPSEKG